MTPPPSMPEDASALSLEEGAAAIRATLAPGETRLLIAVSGGPDSLVLMHAAAHLARHAPEHHVSVACVDHGLRQTSAAEAQAVAEQAGDLGLPCEILCWEDAQKPQRGLQEAARRARYHLLVQEARRIGAQAILTGHTRDDQAETLLIRIAAGSGIDGLAGMAGRRPLTSDDQPKIMLVRPFLGIAKSRLLAACQALGLAPVRDPSNTDPRFARARLRASMDILASEGLTDARLATLAARARQAREGLDFAGEMLFRRAQKAAEADAAGPLRKSEESAIRLDATTLEGAPPVLLMRVLSLALAQLSGQAARDPESSPESLLVSEPPGRIRLARLENLAQALHEALAAREGLKAQPPAHPLARPLARTLLARTLAGARITLHDDGILQLTPAPPRRRGRT